MGEHSAIEWTDHTFNPWIGCTKVSAGCAHCYAERDMDHRYGRVKWGAGQPRSRTGAANWKKPLQWNRKAMESSKRGRVFCASLADWLDPEVPAAWLRDLLVLIADTPYLDWLLLTKRPEQWRCRLKAAADAFVGGEEGALFPWPLCGGGAYDGCRDWSLSWLDGKAPDNVWMGVSVENQDAADARIPDLLTIPARVRFLSCEPLLGPVGISRWLACTQAHDPTYMNDGTWAALPCGPVATSIHWVIVGGESGHQARPMAAEWATSLRLQCAARGVRFFFKQWGAHDEHGRRSSYDSKRLDGLLWKEFPA